MSVSDVSGKAQRLQQEQPKPEAKPVRREEPKEEAPKVKAEIKGKGEKVNTSA